jgi:hypothetical protein
MFQSAQSYIKQTTTDFKNDSHYIYRIGQRNKETNDDGNLEGCGRQNVGSKTLHQK